MPSYPYVPAREDPLGFLRAELAELEVTIAEETHASEGHRHARFDHLDRLLAVAADAAAPEELWQALQARRAAIVPLPVPPPPPKPEPEPEPELADDAPVPVEPEVVEPDPFVEPDPAPFATDEAVAEGQAPDPERE